MVIINDFFVRRKEAVSNQMELIAKENNCEIVAATRFMGQKSLQKEDIKDKIYIYSPIRYPFGILKHLKSNQGIIHVFEETSSKFKEIIFNWFKRPVYVSIYRMPSTRQCKHLKKYKNLNAIFVELEAHREKLVNNGFRPRDIYITPTPTKFDRNKSKKVFDPSNVEILFASWNMSEGNPLYDRGLIYLLDLLVRNSFLKLTVVLRDHNTKQFINEIMQRNLIKRVRLLNPETDEELEEIFENVDFVSFPAQKRIVKDVPNSLVDGLCKGKPVIISNVLNFSDVVAKNNIGIVVENGNLDIQFPLSVAEYEKLSRNAYEYSIIHSKESYVETILKGYFNNNE